MIIGDLEKDIIARNIVMAIVGDLTERYGLRQEWEQIDRGTEYEIVTAWIALAKEQIK